MQYANFVLVSRIFRAGSKIKNRVLLHKGFRMPKSGARINKDTNNFVFDLKDNEQAIESSNRLTKLLLVSRIFRAGSKIKNRVLLHKGFRMPKSGARINQDTNKLLVSNRKTRGYLGDK